jgi:3-hydroxyisobutyrate dehydrogenase-like beta-hydroxyacid dehydrogenase
MKVGFIGTGRMGSAMVARLLAAKHDIGVYNRSPDKLKPLADTGATATSPTPCSPTMPRWKA